jgi:uncharacterized protein
MIFLVICIFLIGLAIRLALQPIINKFLLPQILFSPPETYQIPQNIQMNNSNAWLQFVRPQPTKTALVFFHGNACDISLYTQEGARLSELFNCDVFIPEYPQYNVMKTKFSDLSTHACLPTLVQFMQTRVSSDKYNRIILVGQSLGSHFAIQIAALRLGTDLCLISPFYSIQQVAKSFVGNFLSSFVNAFDSSVPLKKIHHHMPLLIFHGTKDQLISFENAELIMKHSPSKYNRLVPLKGRGHNDLDMNQIWHHVKEWAS